LQISKLELSSMPGKRGASNSRQSTPRARRQIFDSSTPGVDSIQSRRSSYRESSRPPAAKQQRVALESADQEYDFENSDSDPEIENVSADSNRASSDQSEDLVDMLDEEAAFFNNEDIEQDYDNISLSTDDEVDEDEIDSDGDSLSEDSDSCDEAETIGPTCSNQSDGGAGQRSRNAAIFMNFMPVDKPYSSLYGVTLSKNNQLPEDLDFVDDDDSIYWTVEPPSTEEVGHYHLPCSAPNQIQLSPRRPFARAKLEPRTKKFNATLDPELLESFCLDISIFAFAQAFQV